MLNPSDASGYRYDSRGRASHAHSYLAPKVLDIVGGLGVRRLFDLGCGNGSFPAQLAACGYDVTGVDISKEGIATANRLHPHLKLYEGSAYDPLAERFGTFPALLALKWWNTCMPRACSPKLFTNCWSRAARP
jgi:SAM-dependent methyltransferase